MNQIDKDKLRKIIDEAADAVKRMEELKPTGTKKDPYMFIVSPGVYDCLKPYLDENDIGETEYGYFKTTKSDILKQVDPSINAVYYNPHNFTKLDFNNSKE